MLRSFRSLHVIPLRLTVAARPMGTSAKFTSEKKDAPEYEQVKGAEKGSAVESDHNDRKAGMANRSDRTGSEAAVKADSHKKSPEQLQKEGMNAIVGVEG